jgi:hypothetical protein
MSKVSAMGLPKPEVFTPKSLFLKIRNHFGAKQNDIWNQLVELHLTICNKKRFFEIFF